MAKEPMSYQFLILTIPFFEFIELMLNYSYNSEKNSYNRKNYSYNFVSRIIGEGSKKQRELKNSLRDSVGTRTQDPQLRRLLLYPAELRNLPAICGCKGRDFFDNSQKIFDKSVK